MVERQGNFRRERFQPTEFAQTVIAYDKQFLLVRNSISEAQEWEFPKGSVIGLNGNVFDNLTILKQSSRHWSLEKLGIDLEGANLQLINKFSYASVNLRERKASKKIMYTLFVDTPKKPPVNLTFFQEERGVRLPYNEYKWVDMEELENMASNGTLSKLTSYSLDGLKHIRQSSLIHA